jgi:predicted deacylase
MVIVAGREFGRHQRGIARVPVTMMASGHALEVAVHVFAGAAPSPAAALVAGHHGDELFALEVLRAVAHELTAMEILGTVLLVPVANPVAFEGGTRHTPLDMQNLNRVFPGRRDGWLTEQLAAALSEALLPALDVLLDYHCGADATEVDYTYTRPRDDSQLAKRIHQLALLTGARILWETPLPGGTLPGEAERRGIPWCVFEIGGSPAFGSDRLGRAVEHTLSVLRDAGVLRGPAGAQRAEVLIRDGAAVRPTQGGFFVPTVGAEVLGRAIAGGTVVGRVLSPYTFEELDVLRAPYDPSYVMMARTRPSRVHAGDYAFLFGNGTTARRLVDG